MTLTQSVGDVSVGADVKRARLAAKTHRELFSEFYRDLLREPLEDVLAICPRPLASLQLFQRMMHDIMTGGQTSNPIDQASSSVPCL